GGVMSHPRWRARMALGVVVLLPVLSPVAGAEAAVRWVTGYYASYTDLGPPQMHPSDIDYTALTHIIHWPVIPLADGTFNPISFDPFGLGMTETQSAEVVSRAHAAGVKAILGFGGDAATVGTGWRDATANPGTRATLVSNMVNLMQTRGYD